MLDVGKYSNLPERFWSQVNKYTASGCWEWTSNKDKRGYGRIAIGHSKTYFAHRVSWMMENGNINSDVLVLHKCDNPSCVRPDHLFTGTQLDNMRDMVAKGRSPDRTGANGPSAKLTQEQVDEIRRIRITEKLSMTKIAKLFNINSSTVVRIVNRKRWATT